MNNKKDYSLCGHCNTKVLKKDKLVNCDACGCCFHSTCASIDEGLSDALKSGQSGLHWFCEPCNKGLAKFLKDFSKYDEIMIKTETEIKIIKEGLEHQTESLDSIQKSIADLQCTLQTHIEEKPSKALWSDIVNKQVDQKIGVVQTEVKEIHKTIMETKEQVTEEKDKEARKNNIIIHRVAESKIKDPQSRIKHDTDFCLVLLKDVLGVSCDEEELKRVVRLGKPRDTDRPLLVEFASSTTKNSMMESLGKLREADEKYRSISVVHDMTNKEREELRNLVKEAKEKQEKEKSGEWIFRVRGTPGSMRIVRLRVNRQIAEPQTLQKI